MSWNKKKNNDIYIKSFRKKFRQKNKRKRSSLNNFFWQMQEYLYIIMQWITDISPTNQFSMNVSAIHINSERDWSDLPRGSLKRPRIKTRWVGRSIYLFKYDPERCRLASSSSQQAASYLFVFIHSLASSVPFYLAAISTQSRLKDI